MMIHQTAVYNVKFTQRHRQKTSTTNHQQEMENGQVHKIVAPTKQQSYQ